MFFFFVVELGERGKEFSAKDLVSSVISAANRKMKKREKSSKSVSSVDTGSMDSTDLPTVDYQPPCEANERNIDREIELRSITEDSSMDSSIVSSTMSNITPLTGHGMASSSSTLTSTLSQERLLQRMVSSTHHGPPVVLVYSNIEREVKNVSCRKKCRFIRTVLVICRQLQLVEATLCLRL